MAIKLKKKSNKAGDHLSIIFFCCYRQGWYFSVLMFRQAGRQLDEL
jgi:hypothetical protein